MYNFQFGPHNFDFVINYSLTYWYIYLTVYPHLKYVYNKAILIAVFVLEGRSVKYNISYKCVIHVTI